MNALTVAQTQRVLLATQEAATVRRLTTGYAELSKQIQAATAALAAVAVGLSAVQITQLSEYGALRMQVVELLRVAASQSADIIAETQVTGSQLGAGMAYAELQAAGVPVPMQLPLSNFAPQQPGTDDKGLSIDARLATAAALMADDMLTGVANDLADGNDPQTGIIGKIGKFLGGVLGLALRELLRTWQRALKDVYRGQDGRVSGWERVCMKDDRTCMACIMLDGEIYQHPGEFSDHIHGRCALIVARGGKPSRRERSAAWLARQDEATQRAAMGNPCYEAWLRGDIELRDMISMHRTSENADAWSQVGLQKALANAARRRGVMP